MIIELNARETDILFCALSVFADVTLQSGAKISEENRVKLAKLLEARIAAGTGPHPDNTTISEGLELTCQLIYRLHEIEYA